MTLPFAAVAVITQAHSYIGVSALLIVIGFDAVALCYLFSARCSQCRTCLLWLFATFGARLWIPAWFTYCPNCGLAFDTELDPAPGSNQSLQLTAGRPVTPLKFHENFTGITKARHRQRKLSAFSLDQ